MTELSDWITEVTFYEAHITLTPGGMPMQWHQIRYPVNTGIWTWNMTWLISKWKVKVSDSLQPMDCTVHAILQARILEWVAFPFFRGSSQPRGRTQDLPNPGIEPRSPALQVDSLPAELQGKPKNTKVGSLSLLQRIFLTQESNQGLLHCRWILYQLRYEGSGWFYIMWISLIFEERKRETEKHGHLVLCTCLWIPVLSLTAGWPWKHFYDLSEFHWSVCKMR